jgi:hypothetical protein
MPGQSCPVIFGARVPSARRISHAVAANLLAFLLPCAAQGAAPVFPPVSTFASGGNAQFTATADVNRDGKQDVFASNLNGVISILLGNGDGTFKPAKTIASLPAGSYPIVTADFNRDGDPDLAVLEPGSARVLIYLGKGDGTFQAAKTIAVGNSTAYMAVGDVNNDHNPDLIVSAATKTAVGFKVLLGEGNGSFHTPVMITALNGAAGGPLVVGDLNNDGHMDVVSSSTSGSAEVFLGNGNGTFREQSSFYDGGGADSEGQPLLADFYGKGKLDFAVGNYGYMGFQGNVTLFEGNGDGTFSNPTSYNAGFFPVWLAAADLNDDGKLDLVAGNAYSNSVSVLLNQGKGVLKGSPNNYLTGFLESDLQTPNPGLLSIGDFNGDGKPDVAVAAKSGVNVLLNAGGGVLHAPASVEIGQYTGQTFAADFNGDGHLDLAVETVGNEAASVGSVAALFGDGKGDFNVVTRESPEGPGVSVLAGGSFNGNGKTGIAVYQFGDGIEITYNPGNGNFVTEPTLEIPNQPNYLCAGDFNHDGYSDFAVLDGNEVDIYLNKHNDTYSGPVTYNLGSNPFYILCHDVNGDGKVDLVTANNGSNNVSVLLGKGDGTFGAAKEYPAGSKPNVVAFGDFNRDGKIDLAVGGNNVSILLGSGDGTFHSPKTYNANGRVTYLAQGDFRGDGIEDILAVNTDFVDVAMPENIFLLEGKGDGSFAAPVAYGAGADPYWVTVGDFNEDGAPDVMVSDYYSSALSLLLNQRGTRIAMKSSAATVKAGTSVKFTANVSAGVPGSGAPTGSVTFKDGAKTLGTANLASGKASLATASLGKGTHSITADYLGSGSFNPHVSAPTAVKVN